MKTTHNCARHGVTTDVYAYYRPARGRWDTHCKQCFRDKSRGTYVPSPRFRLWADDNAEYRFLRDMGMTPQDIAAKFGVRWESFQRTLYRRVGGKADW